MSNRINLKIRYFHKSLPQVCIDMRFVVAPNRLLFFFVVCLVKIVVKMYSNSSFEYLLPAVKSFR